MSTNISQIKRHKLLSQISLSNKLDEHYSFSICNKSEKKRMKKR